jgi:two-component system, sensor histidine kinase YesM
MKIRLRTIQANLFFSYSALIIVSLLIFAVSFYYYTSSLLKNRASQSHQSICESICEKLDLELQKINTVSMNICYSNLVKEHFYKHLSYNINPDSESNELKVAKYYNAKELMDIFMAIIGPSQMVSQINLYDFSGEMVGAGISNTATKISLSQKSWYPKVLAKNGDKYITSPHPDNLLARVRGGVDDSIYVSLGVADDSKYISLCRVLYDRNWTKQGIVEVEQDCDTIFHGLNDLMRRETGKKSLYIFNNQGELLFPYKHKIDARYYRYLQLTKKQNTHAISATIRSPLDHNREIITYTNSEYSGWKVLIVESQSLVLAPVVTFTHIVFFSCIGLLLLTLLISYVLAKKVTTPIQSIHRAIKKIDLDMVFTQTQPRLTSDLNELEELNVAFQNMSVKLKQSMDALLLSQSQEIQSKILALQSQMNPHFLYNTLATIIIMAEENMKDEVITLCKNVSHMLRYISSHQSQLVKMQTELEYTEKYLECMKFRFRNNLSYCFQIESPMNEITIPKLLIQPLVENAIKHGTRNEPPWKIEIRAFIENNQWRVTVKDNGPGFSPEALANIRQKIRKIDGNGLLPNLELNGMGLLNIYIRLKLVYHEHKVFQIENPLEGGTNIVIGGLVETMEVPNEE